MQYERRWLAVVSLGLSLFLSALDGTIVALALPAIAQHFQLSESLASAVTLSYVIPLTVLILPAGDLVGRFRTLPTFLISVVGFGLGSLTCGLAPNFAQLIVGRVVQGCFGAVIGTQAIAVAAAVVSPGERGRAMGLVGALAPLGGVAGPGIGGLLLARFGWSSIFFVNVPVCLLAALLGIFSLRDVRLGSGQEILRPPVPRALQHSNCHGRDVPLVNQRPGCCTIWPAHDPLSTDLLCPTQRVGREPAGPQEGPLQPRLLDQPLDIGVKRGDGIGLLFEVIAD